MSVKCTEYWSFEDYEPETNEKCHCPVCGGFLSWTCKGTDENLKEIWKPVCNKCKTPLIALPDHYEDTGEETGTGRICPIPKKCVSEEKKDEVS